MRGFLSGRENGKKSRKDVRTKKKRKTISVDEAKEDWRLLKSAAAPPRRSISKELELRFVDFSKCLVMNEKRFAQSCSKAIVSAQGPPMEFTKTFVGVC